MQHAAPIAWNEEGQLEVLTFDLADQTFALEATLVREIMDLLPETTVPGALPLVGSIANFRGKIIPVSDVRLAFGMAPAEATADSRVIVVEMELGDEPCLLGLRTDKVNEVVTLDRSASEEPPLVGMRWRRDHVRSLVRRGTGVVVLPDLATIFQVSTREREHGAAIVSIN